MVVTPCDESVAPKAFTHYFGATKFVNWLARLPVDLVWVASVVFLVNRQLLVSVVSIALNFPALLAKVHC